MLIRTVTNFVFLATALFFNMAVACAGTLSSCSYNGIPLYGKVKFVDSFADIKVQYVSSFADLKVKFVDAFPTSCGKWQKVDSFPDFTVQIVSSFPDIKVQEVSAFPGL